MSHNDKHLVIQINWMVLVTGLRDLDSIQRDFANATKRVNLPTEAIERINRFSARCNRSIGAVAASIFGSLSTYATNPACSAEDAHRVKRDVVQPGGMLPEVGRLFSWAFGTLDASAAQAINSNTANIAHLKASESAMVGVMNHTHSLLVSIQSQVSNMTTALMGIVDEMEIRRLRDSAITRFLSVAEEVSLALDSLGRTVDGLLLIGELAELGKVSQRLLQGPFWDFISSHLAPAVRGLRDVKHMVKYAAKVSVDVCSTHMSVHMSIPDFPSTRVMLYRVFNTPVRTSAGFYGLAGIPAAVAWSSEVVFKFSDSEVSDCVMLPRFSVCAMPRFTEPVNSSCWYGLAHNKSSDICRYMSMDTAEVVEEFIHGYFTFFYPDNSTRLMEITCPFGADTVLTIRSKGAVLIPPKCNLFVDKHRLLESASAPHFLFEYAPSLFLPEFAKGTRPLPPPPKFQIVPDLSDDEAILTGLRSAKDHTDQVVDADHITVIHISMGVVVCLIVVLFALVAGIYCKFRARAPVPVVQHIPMNVVTTDAIGSPVLGRPRS